MSTFTNEPPTDKRQGAAYIPPHRRRRNIDTPVNSMTASPAGGGVTTSSSSGATAGHGQGHRQNHQYNCWSYYSYGNKAQRNGRHCSRQQHNNSKCRTRTSRLDFVIAHTRVCCINLPTRTDKWESVMSEARKVGGQAFCQQIEKFAAFDGRLWGKDCRSNKDSGWTSDLIQVEWDTTQNAKYSHRVTSGLRTMTSGEIGCALSHVRLWKSHVEDSIEEEMLILEDDCIFVSHKGRTRFPRALAKSIQLLPTDWGILYLGFSSRGPRQYINNSAATEGNCLDDPPVQLYHPTYGFHTHAYLITKVAAKRLLECLPVTGPIDVWLADNQWFGIPTYCSVIANEGWYNEETESYEGANLVGQKKWRLSSDVVQSAPVSEYEQTKHEKIGIPRSEIPEC